VVAVAWNRLSSLARALALLRADPARLAPSWCERVTPRADLGARCPRCCSAGDIRLRGRTPLPGAALVLRLTTLRLRRRTALPGALVVLPATTTPRPPSNPAARSPPCPSAPDRSPVPAVLAAGTARPCPSAHDPSTPPSDHAARSPPHPSAPGPCACPGASGCPDCSSLSFGARPRACRGSSVWPTCSLPILGP
jgi:hypothetical protein